MPAKIILQILQGDQTGKEFVFTERTVCLLGRAAECYIRLPANKEHQTVSRHHCLLDVNPPQARIRDLGSLNGTFVNDVKIGQREKEQSPEEAARAIFTECDLKHGDRIKLGKTVFEVTIFSPAICRECREEIPEEVKEKARVNDGTFLCNVCRAKAQETELEAAPAVSENLAPGGYEEKAGPPQPPPPLPQKKVCAKCGKAMSEKVPGQGEMICDACRRRPRDLADNLLKKAQVKEELSGLKKYTILKELGKGGMGAVYQVRHQETGLEVALKVMLPQIAADKKASARFLREIELNKGLRHRSVVRMYECGFSDGIFFFYHGIVQSRQPGSISAEKGGAIGGGRSSGPNLPGPGRSGLYS